MLESPTSSNDEMGRRASGVEISRTRSRTPRTEWRGVRSSENGGNGESGNMDEKRERKWTRTVRNLAHEA
jgi:hypothetical protein